MPAQALIDCAGHTSPKTTGPPSAHDTPAPRPQPCCNKGCSLTARPLAGGPALPAAPPATSAAAVWQRTAAPPALPHAPVTTAAGPVQAGHGPRWSHHYLRLAGLNKDVMQHIRVACCKRLSRPGRAAVLTPKGREMARACSLPSMLQGLPCCAPEAAAAQAMCCLDP